MTTEGVRGEVIDGRNDVMLSDCSRLRTLSAPEARNDWVMPCNGID